MAAKTAEELREKKDKLEALREKDKRTVAAMGQALTQSQRAVKQVSSTLEKQRTLQKKEVKKASAVLEDTKISLEVAKQVSYYLYEFDFSVLPFLLSTFIQRSMALPSVVRHIDVARGEKLWKNAFFI